MPGAVSTFIDDRRSLEALCDQLAGFGVLAVDTEFIREKSYVPSLELVQVAAPDGTVAAIDYQRIGRYEDDPFAALLRDPEVLKVFHAADQDLEMFHLLTGVVPAPIWDTQLVTGLIGYTGRLGYQAVVENMLGHKPTKGETLTDWSQRPLTPEQLHYALEDVRYLIPLYEAEVRELSVLGRLDWASEECERARAHVERTIATRADMQTLFYKVKGWSGLDRRGLAVLRELAIWREQEAARRNRPRGSVLRDEFLVELARRSPSQEHQLRAIRGLQPRDLERHADAILASVKRGKAVPPEACPVPDSPGPQLDDAEAALASLLHAVLQVISAEKLVSSTLVATVADLQRLVEAHRKGTAADLPVLKGWRGELVGHTLVSILTGELAVQWDPRAKHLRLNPALA
ncbi:MAG: ribonuclease D [Candidatus Sericytochromatia bacterium]|nr:ribonuclease D [Candidatus Sericytochromatia bacterium]